VEADGFKPRFMSNPKDFPQIEICRVGDFTSVEGVQVSFSMPDLCEMRDSYNAGRDPAPLVIGHPALNDPAYGWTSGLEIVGDRLVANPDQVDTSFAEMVAAGRFKRVSPQIYPRDHAGNPTPGKLHLKHIGFLGAAAPAIKGLKPVSFSEAQQEGCMTFENPLKENLMPDPKDENKAKELSFAEREAVLATREATIAADEAKLADERKKLADAAVATRKADALSFAESQVSAGKLAPAGKDKVAFLLETLSAPDVLSFGEGDKAETPAAIFKGLFDKAGTIVSFGEFAKAEEKSTATLSFAAPTGYAVDQASLALHERAVSLQAENPNLSYVDAVLKSAG
jgi:hypothetical protein